MSLTLRMENISKSFLSNSILDKVSWSFTKGCHILLGENGIGKTVLLELLAGIARPDEGTVLLGDSICNTSIEYKQQLVYVPSKCLFFPSATGWDFINFILSVKKYTYQSCAINSMLKKFKLISKMDDPFSIMSLGTQKKLFLSTLAIGENSIIILDEPTNALDSESHDVLCELLTDMAKHSIVIIATHDFKLIKKLSPTIIELRKEKTTKLIINNTYRLSNDEEILQFN